MSKLEDQIQRGLGILYKTKQELILSVYIWVFFFFWKRYQILEKEVWEMTSFDQKDLAFQGHVSLKLD